MANRTLVLIDEDGVVEWTYESPSPGESSGPQVILDAPRRGPDARPGVYSLREREREF